MSDVAPLPLPALPEAFLETLAELARETFGRAAPEGSVLAAAIGRTSLTYTRQRDSLLDPGADPATLTARLRYFLPRDLFKLWGPLQELAAANQLPGPLQSTGVTAATASAVAQAPQDPNRPLRVLDVGAGLGTSSLGLASFAHARGVQTGLEITAIDADPHALALYERLLERPKGLAVAATTVHPRCERWTPETRVPAGPFDVIVLGLALNEILLEQPLDARAGAGERLLRACCAELATDGCLIALEPALREPSRVLQEIRDALHADPAPPFVFAPCLGVQHCPLLKRDRDWCHQRLPSHFPPELASLSRDAGLRDSDLTFSYLTLRTRPGHLAQGLRPDLSPYRIVGGPVGSKGKVEYALCGEHDAPQLQRLDRDRPYADEPDPLAGVGRGTILGLNPEQARPQAHGSSTPSTAKPVRLRVTQQTSIQVLQQWSPAEYER